jgi:hypothetical protein
MNRNIILLIGTIALWICSCVEPFNLNIKSDLRLLTIDASLTDSSEEQTISIMESVNSSGKVVAIPVLKVSAELEVNGATRIPFKEKGLGKYALPTTFRAKAGNTYKLFFKKSDGSAYESSVDKMFSVPEIINVHDKFVYNGIDKNFGFEHANYVYLDTKDPVEEKTVMFGHGNCGNAKMYVLRARVDGILILLAQPVVKSKEATKASLMIIIVKVIVGRCFLVKN